ncbi:hypothetical protein AHAS_Ahas11G0275300 [Arachis hypogaea]
MVEQNQKQIADRKFIDIFGQRTSQYRGVTRHKWTGSIPAWTFFLRLPLQDYGWNIVANFRGSNIGIGGDELVRGHYNKETKNCVRTCYLYCTCIKCLEKEYIALCKV